MKFIFLVVLFAILAFYRNNLILKYRLKAISIISDNAKTDMLAGKSWKHNYDELDNYGTYIWMLIDVRKWTFNHFYGSLYYSGSLYYRNKL